MILYEFEGKKLLKQAGISVPNSELITKDSLAALQNDKIQPPVVLKAQVLSGKRADAGGIIIVDSGQFTVDSLKQLFSKTINGEKVEQILVEEKIEIDQEFYISISYDTEIRGPILTLSESGGTGIEERGAETFEIDPLTKNVILVSNSQPESDPGGDRASQDDELTVPHDIIQKLINLFFDQDMLLLEINPLVKTKNGEWVALDAKIKLDDDAKFRHSDPPNGNGEAGWDFPPRSAPGHTSTENEIAAKKIDEGDYRGTAGSAYFDLDGDIAILSSGGGVSLTAMDALKKVGGKPANFTEYSGNPPKEKVVKLTKIVLGKPNIHGLWVIGTVAANFTDIYETLSGIIEGLKEAEKELGTKFNFPIVIRRGGPRVDEAYEMLRSVKDFDLHLEGEETSIAESAKIMTDLAEKYSRLERSKDNFSSTKLAHGE